MTMQRLIEIAKENYTTQAYAKCYLCMSSTLGEHIKSEFEKQCNVRVTDPPIFAEINAMYGLRLYSLSDIPVIYDDTMVNQNEWQICRIHEPDIVESGIVERDCGAHAK